MQDTPIIFDRQRVRQHRDRAGQHITAYDLVLQECAARLADCLQDLRHGFSTVIELGARHGVMRPLLPPILPEAKVIACDISAAMLQPQHGMRVVLDEELLPFAAQSVDAVISCMGLHWVNDLPGCLAQIRRILKPDGLLLASLPGPATLQEWKQAALAAAEATGRGLPPMVSPFVDIRDAGALLQRSGFALPVVDQDELTIDYASPLQLAADLRHTGENNALAAQPRHCCGKDWFAALCAAYQQHFANPDGTVPATLEIVTLTAWAPHASQQQPAKRGSGEVSMTEALK